MFLFEFLLVFYIFVIDLLRHVLFISLFIGFCVIDSDNIVTSIRQKSHIKSLFVSILNHIRIISCIGFEPFLFAIN